MRNANTPTLDVAVRLLNKAAVEEVLSDDTYKVYANGTEVFTSMLKNPKPTIVTFVNERIVMELKDGAELSCQRGTGCRVSVMMDKVSIRQTTDAALGAAVKTYLRALLSVKIGA